MRRLTLAKKLIHYPIIRCLQHKLVEQVAPSTRNQVDQATWNSVWHLTYAGLHRKVRAALRKEAATSTTTKEPKHND